MEISIPRYREEVKSQVYLSDDFRKSDEGKVRRVILFSKYKESTQEDIVENIRAKASDLERASLIQLPKGQN